MTVSTDQVVTAVVLSIKANLPEGFTSALCKWPFLAVRTEKGTKNILYYLTWNLCLCACRTRNNNMSFFTSSSTSSSSTNRPRSICCVSLLLSSVRFPKLYLHFNFFFREKSVDADDDDEVTHGSIKMDITKKC